MFNSKRTSLLNVSILASALSLGLAQVGAAASPGDVTVLPKSGQTADQIEKAKGDCYQKAKDTTGFDPKAAYSSSNQEPKGGAGRGAVKGAAVGAVGGAIGGSAGTGAAVGAGVGAAAGHHKKKEQEKQAQADQAKMDEQNKSAMTAFTKSETSCLKGKGYEVSAS